MLDRWTSGLVRPWLGKGAVLLEKSGIGPDGVTVAGFLVGMAGAAAVACHFFLVGLVCILVNRCADGLDGALARRVGSSDAGGYLDIVLDFIFYAGIVLAFALADPDRNSFAAALLLFSFMGTGASFLAFAIMAERRGLQNVRYPHKGFYYLGGLAEGTETICFFVLCCLFPSSFQQIALFFSACCILTTLTRVVGGYRTIRADELKSKKG